jgi:hypothetical protein
MSEKKKQELKVVSTPKAPAEMTDEEIMAWAKGAWKHLVKDMQPESPDAEKESK